MKSKNEKHEEDKKATREIRILSSKSVKYSRNGDAKCISCIQFYYIYLLACLSLFINSNYINYLLLLGYAN